MALHLEEISQTVTPGAHAVLLLDQAGWHLSAKLDIPGNITLMPLPSKSPELNPVENIWQFMRDNWRPPRTWQFWPVRDSMGRVRDGGGGCAVRLGFSTLRSG